MSGPWVLPIVEKFVYVQLDSWVRYEALDVKSCKTCIWYTFTVLSKMRS